MNIKNAKHCMCIFFRIEYFSLPVHQNKILFVKKKNKTQTDASHRAVTERTQIPKYQILVIQTPNPPPRRKQPPENHHILHSRKLTVLNQNFTIGA